MLNQYVNKSLRSSTPKWCGRCGYAQNGVVMFKENLNRPIAHCGTHVSSYGGKNAEIQRTSYYRRQRISQGDRSKQNIRNRWKFNFGSFSEAEANEKHDKNER